MGDPNYDQFCGHGKNLDTKLDELGATRLVARADCDTDFESKADEWLSSFIVKVSAKSDVSPAVSASSTAPTPAINKHNPYSSKLLLNQKLSGESSNKDTHWLAFDIRDSCMNYEAGDALGVWPQNCPDLVNEVMELAGLQSSALVDVDGHGTMTLAQALTTRYEISKPSPDMLGLLASQHRSIKHLLTNDSKLKDWLWGRQLVDILHEFPMALDAPELLALLRPLQPRQYSISSSPLAHAGSVHVTVSAVRYDGARKQRKGVASSFLTEHMQAGNSAPIFIQKSAHFRLPTDGNRPIIMVGPGTGIAPFRGFLHERRAKGDSGKNWLFFGEQHRDSDFYYREELEAFQKDGFLNRLDLAFSRDGSKKVYVQDRMREQGAGLWAWLEADAIFYVCGDANHMAKDVEAVLKEVISKHGGKTAAQANDYLTAMKWDKRYRRDVY